LLLLWGISVLVLMIINRLEDIFAKKLVKGEGADTQSTYLATVHAPQPHPTARAHVLILLDQQEFMAIGFKHLLTVARDIYIQASWHHKRRLNHV
jgi:hypothetical protein